MGNPPRISCPEGAYFIIFLFLLHLHPRRPRGSQSAQEKRRDESLTVQIGMFLLIASEMFSRVIGSSFISGQGSRYESFPCAHNLGERTGQVWRDMGRRVRTHEKNLTYAVHRFGTIVKIIFICAHPGVNIRFNFLKWFGEIRYPGALSLVLFAPFLSTRQTAPRSPRILLLLPIFSCFILQYILKSNAQPKQALLRRTDQCSCISNFAIILKILSNVF